MKIHVVKNIKIVNMREKGELLLVPYPTILDVHM